MKRLRKLASIILATVLIATFVWAGWNVVQWLVGLEPAIAGPTLAATLGFIGLVLSQWYSKGREIEQSHRPQKIEVYNEFFLILERFIKEPDSAHELSDGEIPSVLKDQFWSLNRGLIVWASPPVIRAWLQFRTVSQSGGDTLTAMDGVLKAIRKDLGNSNIGLNPGDAVKVFLSDPSEYDRVLAR